MALELTPKQARARAHSAVRCAILRGDLEVPNACEQCKSAVRFGRDGRRLLQAHHHNGHENKLDVIWLCVGCHRAVTPANPKRGTDVKNSRLNEDAVRDIRSSSCSLSTLGRKYGVDFTAIYQVRARKTWRWVDDV